jgi:hypothetical protein
MWLLFIKLHSTSTRTSAWSDHRAEPAGQIRIPDPELVCGERSTSNVPPPQCEHIQAQSAGHNKPEWSITTSSPAAGMRIQFKTLMFHSKPAEQLQERINCIKKSPTSLPAVMGALGSPLGPHLESGLARYLYSGSTPIAIMDESGRQISVTSHP